jgi:hypothetical protein
LLFVEGIAMRVYVHRERHHEAEVVETANDATIAEALGIDGNVEVVLLEEADEPLDSSARITEVPDRAHLFVGRRHRIEVVVVFNADEHAREFSASAGVERVFRWATGKRAFDLSDADAAEHTLALPDGTVPGGDVHLGSLDDATPGHLRFSLIPKHRFEG